MKRFSIILLALMLFGCATNDPVLEEYDRIEWVETEFKPMIAECKRSGGTVTYTGPYSQRVRRILDREDWLQVRRSEQNRFGCARNIKLDW